MMDDVTQHPFAQLGVQPIGEYRDDTPVAAPPGIIAEDDRIGDQYRPPMNRQARRAYVRRAKTYRLVWAADSEYTGLEVRAKSLPLGSFMELIDLATVFDQSDMADLSAEDAQSIRKLFEGFSDALVSWNLERPVFDPETGEEIGSEPVPPTVAGLYTVDMELTMVIIQKWMDAVASVSPPLSQGSPAGEPSLEASMPMAVRSPNPTS